MENDDVLSFPDPGRSELDVTLASLVAQASQVLKTQGRLRALIKANRAVTDELELGSVLRRIVTAAIELVDAEFGAIGVMAPHGGLEQFIHVGMPIEDAERIGHLPSGRGLLGVMIEEARPIRLDDFSEDPRSVGLPPHHPPMTSFLGVPITVRDEVFGNLYLTNKRDGTFSSEDVHLLGALAATAGVAIENARLFEETKRRQAWTAASLELTSAVLEQDSDSADALLCRESVQLADADSASVLEPSENAGGGWRRNAARNREEDAQLSAVSAEEEVIANTALDADTGSFVASMGGDQPGSVLAVKIPLPQPRVLVLRRRAGRTRFTAFDVRMAAAFCAQLAVAMELVNARQDQQHLMMMNDRGRIARDLHDHVIQRLFGTGLGLQTIAASVPPHLAPVLDEAIDSLDASIAQIRTVVFALTATNPRHTSMRQRLLEVAEESARSLGHRPITTFSGAVDHIVTADQAEELLAVCREALSNTAKHAAATTTTVHLATEDDLVTLTLTDDGHGFDLDNVVRASGLQNLRERAALLGGTCDIHSSPAGTHIRWRIPATNDHDGDTRSQKAAEL